MQRLVEGARVAIKKKQFAVYKKNFIKKYKATLNKDYFQYKKDDKDPQST
jgi:queuine/archaeosine tRNA-ribosyltransferase